MDSKLHFPTGDALVETQYAIENEALHATLFAVSNGYFGCRGSFEEFASGKIQGFYVRGVLDQLVEAPQHIAVNEYMRTHYFDEERTRGITHQECVINVFDPLYVRVDVGGQTFRPWEGKVVAWERKLDLRRALLTRRCVWEDASGRQTEFVFERFASFADDHLLGQRIKISPLNHDSEIVLTSGLDANVRTAGQKPAVAEASETRADGSILHRQRSGDHYRFLLGAAVRHKLQGVEAGAWADVRDDGRVGVSVKFTGRRGGAVTLDKLTFVTSSREVPAEKLAAAQTEALARFGATDYDALRGRHEAAWREAFARMDIRLAGDPAADGALRFCNYHTLISIPRNDAIHSMAAKGLTGEAYNNFVWWDCEVYQTPPFIMTNPEWVKNVIRYRYDRIDAARAIAKAQGLRGARFPFNSAVTGEEVVWRHVRHPQLQIHIVADVAWNLINYFEATGDEATLRECGLEIVWECARYWVSRAKFDAARGRYVILQVTGTDEHHPYVDNDAYTNYLAVLVLRRAVEFFDCFGASVAQLTTKIGLEAKEVAEWRKMVEQIYLPYVETSGLIPQFDGYFDLSVNLEVAGGGNSGAYQMKQSGLYHKSQVIKQPDVLVLPSYINLRWPEATYRRNWDCYETRCEISSSLSFPVHAICAADNDQPERAYQYFLKTVRIDLDDVHHNAAVGIHSACTAGAWYAVVRGFAGIVFRNGRVEIDPHPCRFWSAVDFALKWRGQRFEVTLTRTKIELRAAAKNGRAIPLAFRDARSELAPAAKLSFDLTPADPRAVRK